MGKLLDRRVHDGQHSGIFSWEGKRRTILTGWQQQSIQQQQVFLLSNISSRQLLSLAVSDVWKRGRW
jgi:hypothetical protein